MFSYVTTQGNRTVVYQFAQSGSRPITRQLCFVCIDRTWLIEHILKSYDIDTVTVG